MVSSVTDSPGAGRDSDPGATAPHRFRLYVDRADAVTGRRISEIVRHVTAILHQQPAAVDVCYRDDPGTRDDILAVPMLERIEPQPALQVVGELMDTQTLLQVLREHTVIPAFGSAPAAPPRGR